MPLAVFLSEVFPIGISRERIFVFFDYVFAHNQSAPRLFDRIVHNVKSADSVAVYRSAFPYIFVGSYEFFIVGRIVFNEIRYIVNVSVIDTRRVSVRITEQQHDFRIRLCGKHCGIIVAENEFYFFTRTLFEFFERIRSFTVVSYRTVGLITPDSKIVFFFVLLTADSRKTHGCGDGKSRRASDYSF